MKIMVGVSNRHVHLNKEDLDILFGKDYTLSVEFPLTQVGMFGAKELVTIYNGNKKIDNVRIVGPIRDYTQIEVCTSDALYLGLNPPLRNSGDLTGSSPISIKGPKGIVHKTEGCIRALRHIHVPNRNILNIKSKEVDLIFNGLKMTGVQIKEGKDFVLELHLDKDEEKIFNLKNRQVVDFIIKDSGNNE